ncbi:aldo/keto reductase [Kouleothrix aurantiaca]|uniref:Aldo/keto reductase n=1 Tax=Kouleothrix aurantiaca TaxID=186479 RepID=A0A0P9CX41_9CHLR|nr:aldo/keto reductase [Kouleothrix aurantiaca]
MEYVTLGRTGLRASVLGLGGGGHSRLGQKTGASADDSSAIVRRALELGVNFIDTAEAYGTEALIGAALQGVNRQDVILSTKKSPVADGQPISAQTLVAALDASLARLGTDYVDIYHLHGVRAEHYARAAEELVPALERLRDAGKIRFLGITEVFGSDTGHAMLARAVHDPCWDVMMVGFNMLNQSARERVLAETQRRGIGTLCMFAVRDALSRPAKLREVVAGLVAQGALDPAKIDLDNALGFLLEAADSLPEAAYRFCRAEPGLDVILSGTGNPQHLEENVAAIVRPPLPEPLRQRVIDLFGAIDSVSGQ